MCIEKDDDELTLRTKIQISCEEQKLYDITQRIAFVSEEILQEIFLTTPDEARKILTKHGY